MSFLRHKDGRIEHSFDEINEHTNLEHHHTADECTLVCELPNGRVMHCGACVDGEGKIEYIELDSDFVRNSKFEHGRVTSVEALKSFGIERVTLLSKYEVEGFDTISFDTIK